MHLHAVTCVAVHLAARKLSISMSTHLLMPVHTAVAGVAARLAARKPSTSMSGTHPLISSYLKHPKMVFSCPSQISILTRTYRPLNHTHVYRDSMAGNEEMKNLPKLGINTRKLLPRNSSCGLVRRMILVLGIPSVAL